jgi:hypothetical protein
LKRCSLKCLKYLNNGFVEKGFGWSFACGEDGVTTGFEGL